MLLQFESGEAWGKRQMSWDRKLVRHIRRSSRLVFHIANEWASAAGGRCRRDKPSSDISVLLKVKALYELENRQKLFKIDQSGDGFGWNHHNSELRLFPALYFTFLRTPENTLLGS